MMKTKFMVDGSTVHVFNMNEDTALDNLPAKVYTVKFNPLTGFYLSITKDELEIPKKIYGNTPERVQKCIDTYCDRSTSTGILLTGDKGTGKTLLMSLLANKVISDLHLPVILVKDPFAGSQFVTFIETLGECCLVFDEFGKMYAAADRHLGEGDVPQKELLSLMDGVDKTKRMFILSENSELDINEFMLNRPSRIYYHFKYKKLDESSVIGYCEDHEIDNSVVKDIVDISRRSRIFSFDMLQSIVEEQKRFNTPVDDIIVDLNIDLREEHGAMIEIEKIVEKGTEAEKEIFDTPFVQKPEGRHRYTYIKIKTDRKSDKKIDELDDENESFDEVCISYSDLAYEASGKLVYQGEDYIVVAKDVPQKNFNISDFLL